MKARILLWILGIGCLFLPVFGEPPLRSGAYVQRVVGDRAVVAKITAEPTELFLELEAEDGGSRRLHSSRRRRHVFELENLGADQVYEYAVLDSDGVELDRGSFRSAPDRDDSRIRFALVGDSGEFPRWIALQRSALLQLPIRWNWLPLDGDLTRTAERMAEAAPDFWLHAGDVVYPTGRYSNYNTSFFLPFADLLRRSPVYAVLGNHDLLDDEGRQLSRNLVLPVNSLSGDERFFSFAYGAVRVIGVDLNEHPRIGADHPGLVYLREELPQVSEPWIVVMSHFPIYSASFHGDRPDLKKFLVPLLRRYQVDLYFSGHDHIYQRFLGDFVQVTSGGGGKELYVLEDHPLLAKAQREHHFCLVEVSGPELTLQAIGNDSGVMDELRLDKGEFPERLAALEDLNPRRHRRILALLR